MAERKQRRIHAILVRCCWILFGVLAVVVYYRVQNVFRPSEINYILIINGSTDSITLPATFTFTGDSEKEVSFGGGMLPVGSAATGRSLAIFRFKDAFFGGSLFIEDSNGKTWRIERFDPPGRYCGTLVLLFRPQGHVTYKFNRIPVESDGLQNDNEVAQRNVMIEGGGSARVTWSYDKQNQLTGENRTGTNAYRQTYTYDPGGNRTLKNISSTRTTYSYDAANQLTYGQTATGRTTYVYDTNRNQQIEIPAAGNRTTTTWNYENQPTLYRLPSGGRVTMLHNGDNRRIETQEP